MNNNVGFRQYKLPNDVCLDGEIEFSPRAGGVEVDAVHGLEFVIDGREDTYCQLNGDSSNVEWNKMDLVVTFEKPIACDYVKVVFENKMINTEVRDFSDGGDPLQAPIILQQGNEASAAVENIVDREMSAIVVTNFTPNDEQTDTIKIKEISVYSNEIIPPEGFYIKDIEIQSDTSDSLNGEGSTKKKFLTSIDMEDFQKGELTLNENNEPVILGKSEIIRVSKNNGALVIEKQTSEEESFIKNFNIIELEQQPNICVFTWDVKKVSNKYRLKKDAIVEFENFKNGYRYDFSQMSDGVYYDFYIECLCENNYIKNSQDNEHVYYTYPYLTIPIDYNCKYYFYYRVNNIENFGASILSANILDQYGSYLIRDNEFTENNIDNYLKTEDMQVHPLQGEEGCYNLDLNSIKIINFNERSNAGYPFNYFIPVLDLKPIEGVAPIVNKIDVYVEKINAEEGESNGSE